MNLMSLQKYEYKSLCTYNIRSKKWELYLSCDLINDHEAYTHLTVTDFEILRDNAKNIYDAINEALEKANE